MSKIDLEDLIGQFRLIIKESNIDDEEAKALGRILNKLIKEIERKD